MRYLLILCVAVIGLCALASDEATRAQAESDGVALTSGEFHTVGIKPDGTLIIFGRSGDGQRDGFPEGVRFKSVSAGDHYTCGIKEDGTLLCFGNPESVQRKNVPQGVRFKSVSCGRSDFCGIKEDGTLLCSGPWEMGGSLESGFPFGERFRSISTGRFNACGVKDDGTFLCFSPYTFVPFNEPKGAHFKSISVGGYLACGIKEDDTLQCFGSDHLKTSMDMSMDVRLRSISSGDAHSCGITEEGQLLCIGGSKENSQKDVPVGVRFRSISAGRGHACGVTEEGGRIVCFGQDSMWERNDMPTEEFLSFPALTFDSFELGLLKLTEYVYPEKKGFVTSVAIISGVVPPPEDHGAFSSLGYKQASARLLAFNYLEPFLADIETEVVETKVLPKYRSELSKWNDISDVVEVSDIFFSDQSYSVSLDYLIAALRACASLESDEAKHSEISQLLTSLGEIKASGVVRVGDVLLELDSHEGLLSSLRQSSSTKGFAGVIEQVRGYLAAQIRELK